MDAKQTKKSWLESWKTKKFCVLNIYLFISHKICFSCSPINSERFEAQHKETLSVDGSVVKSNSELWMSSYKPERINWFRVLCRPMKIIKLIKRYHMADNKFIILVFLHLAIIFHLTIKALINFFYTGSDEERMKFFDGIYYPHSAGVSTMPASFNYMLLANCIYCLAARLRCLIRIIKGSIRNRNIYTEISTTQVNYSFLTLIFLNYYQTKTIWRKSLEHKKALERNDKLSLENHIKFEEKTQTYINNLSRNDLLYYYNFIDFDACSKEFDDIIKLDNRREDHKQWFCPKPLWRTDLISFHLGMLLNLLAIVLIGGGFLFACFGVTYMELRSRFREDDEPSLIELFSNYTAHYSEPIHILRSIDFLLFIAAQVPHHFDSITIFADTIILIFRIGKLVTLMKMKLVKLFDWNSLSSPSGESFATVRSYLKSSGSEDHDWIGAESNYNPAKNFDQENNIGKLEEKSAFNKKLQNDLSIVRVLFLEFNDLKRCHSGLLNQLVIGHGIMLVVIFTLFLKISTDREFYLLIIAAASSIAGPTAVLVFCALVEKGVSICDEYLRIPLAGDKYLND